MSIFGKVLKNIRTKNNDSLRTLGNKAEMVFTYVDKIEKGERPVNKEILEKLLKVYPEYEKELTEAYLEEVLPDGIAKKVIQDKKHLLTEGNDKKLIDYLLTEANEADRKAILELMVLQREVEARKNGTYEERKKEIEEMRKLVSQL